MGAPQSSLAENSFFLLSLKRPVLLCSERDRFVVNSYKDMSWVGRGENFFALL